MAAKPRHKTHPQASRGHIFACDLIPADIEELRLLVTETPRAMPHECFWREKRFLVEELERFLWYYDNRPHLHGQMACEYELVRNEHAP